MADNPKRVNFNRFLLMSVLILISLGLIGYFHLVHGISTVYTHLFYIPIILDAFWWGFRGGVAVSLFLGLINFISFFPIFSGVDIGRLFVLVFVGSVTGAISDRRKVAEGSHAMLAAIVESSNDAIIGKELDGTIMSWNAGAEKIYGYTAEEIIGRSISVLLPPDRPDELREILEKIKQHSLNNKRK